jgi:DNA-binding NarL/FixJ family response regulator
MSLPPFRILIVDDHAIVRAGLKQLLLEEHPDCDIGEASNGTAALKLVREKQWDLLLLDINLPCKNGIEVLKQVRLQCTDLPVLILSMYEEDQYAVRALKAGANGYMTKESAPEELMNAVHRVLNGMKYISNSLAEELADQLSRVNHDKPHGALSDREMDILIRIASGNTVSEIGKQLSLSVKTISTYRARILKKMNMKHNAELTHYAIKQGLAN